MEEPGENPVKKVKKQYKRYLCQEELDRMCKKLRQRVEKRNFPQQPPSGAIEGDTGDDQGQANNIPYLHSPSMDVEDLFQQYDQSESDYFEYPSEDGIVDETSIIDEHQSSQEDSFSAPGNNLEDRTERESPTGFLNDNSLNELFGNSGLTKIDILSCLHALCLKHHATNAFREDIFALLKLCANVHDDSFSCSKYIMSKIFDPNNKDALKYVFYCDSCMAALTDLKCKRDIKNEIVKCKNSACHKEHSISLTSENYFIIVDVTEQIVSLLNPETVNDILQQCPRDNSVIRDVQDGQVYKDAKRKIEFDLTYNFNIDGAPIFNSSNRSMWPIQLLINELNPKKRFRRLVLAGIWVGNKEPNIHLMNTFINFFANQAEKLIKDGVTVKNDNDGYTTFRLAPLLCSVDSVARPLLQNRMKFNGYFGCSWCYQKGQPVKGRQIKYPFEKDISIRTMGSHMNDLRKVAEIRYADPVRGVKGPSTIIHLPHCDPVWSFPIDYMHAILLGVTRQLWELWTSYTLENKHTFYVGSPHNLKKINDRLINIKPPHEIHRLPRKMCAKLKAQELRSWLLFYSLPCLKGILDDKYLQHFALLVKSVNELLKPDISTANLSVIQTDLTRFIKKFQKYYGLSAMTFNVHSLLHLVESVRRTGPLWATSAFPFESRIFNIKQQINGPVGVAKQIAKQMYNINTFASHLDNNTITLTETAKMFCTNLFFKDHKTGALNCSEFLLLGHPTLITGDQTSILAENSFDNNSAALAYDRCIYKNTLLNGAKYQRAKRNDDSFIEINGGQIAQILYFISSNNKAYMYVQMFDIQEFSCGNIVLSHIFEISTGPYKTIIPLERFERKCLLIEIASKKYVCYLPNTFEVQ